MRQRLLDHLNGDNLCIIRYKSSYWVVEVVKNPDAREKELIVELSPIYNQRVG